MLRKSATISFTFHYGSILIGHLLLKKPLKSIYIPLWFYSNMLALIIKIIVSIFTFHYGSILISSEYPRR